MLLDSHDSPFQESKGLDCGFYFLPPLTFD